MSHRPSRCPRRSVRCHRDAARAPEASVIAATSRERVAALSGDDWWRFLDRSFDATAFEHGTGQLLTRLAYAGSMPASISSEQMRTLLDLSRRWIKHHHADI
ncbi:DUF4381 domain-containing protein [Povalibacter sp.]|uniref:DUF4381 domain-containing protein n=1 Tax=Povalibacter sp. TaxID=1962978 RepID=UPI002F3EE352